MLPLPVAIHESDTRDSRKKQLTSTSFVNPIQNRLSHNVGRRLHLGAIIPRPPTTTVDRRRLVSEIQSNGFIRQCDSATENTQTSDLALVCDAYAAHPIFGCANLACATGTVMVAGGFWDRGLDMVVKVVGVLCVLMRL